MEFCDDNPQRIGPLAIDLCWPKIQGVAAVAGSFGETISRMDEFTFFEFFAGGGMARAGLAAQWRCLFANDFDRKKRQSYTNVWGETDYNSKDVRTLEVAELPGTPDLAWASFPCQDLSLAGGGAGLRGDRSGTFWPFWNLMEKLIDDRRAPKIIALENVCGTLTSHGGRDFTAICVALAQAHYRVGALVIDASIFVPQSRPRLFVIGVRNDVSIPPELFRSDPSPLWHPRTVLKAYDIASSTAWFDWVWWRPPSPTARTKTFAAVIEDDPADVNWHTQTETKRILAMMTDVNLAKVAAAKVSGKRKVGAVYKRTRLSEDGRKVQRAEVRFDDVAGCLRTPAGGSSRQLILVVQGETVRSRLISGRETARLMGLPDSYRLPPNYNEAYHLMGDGVVVPVVRHLARYIFEPILVAFRTGARAAA